MFIRFGFNNNSWFTPQPFGILGGPSLSSTNTATGNGFGHIFNDTVSGTYVFTPHLLMDASVGYSRNDNSTRQIGEDQNYGDTLLHIPGLSNAGLNPQLMTFLNGMPQFTVAGFASIGGIPSAFEPYDYSDAEHDYVANINWIHGSHDLRAGIDLDRQGVNEWQAMGIGGGNTYSTAAGGFNFTQGTTQLSGGPAGNDFNAWASFLLRDAGQRGQDLRISSERDIHVARFELYAHAGARPLYSRSLAGIAQADGDVRRPRRRLHLAESRRWTRAGISGSANQFHSDLRLFRSSGELRDHARPAAPGSARQHRLSRQRHIRDSRRRGPRERSYYSSLIQLRLNAPYVYTQVLSAPNTFGSATTLAQGIPTVPIPNLTSGSVSWPGNANVLTLNNGNWVRGYMETWNLTLEKRFGGWTSSLGYAGTRAVDPRDQLEQNWGSIGTGAAGQQFAPFGRTASVLLFATEGTTKYDALQAHLQHQFASGFQLALSYTFSKTLGFANLTPTNGSNGTPPVAIPAYYYKNYGPMQTNVPQNFQATAVYQLPFGKGRTWMQKGIMSEVLGGWQLSGFSAAIAGCRLRRPPARPP